MLLTFINFIFTHFPAHFAALIEDKINVAGLFSTKVNLNFTEILFSECGSRSSPVTKCLGSFDEEEQKPRG